MHGASLVSELRTAYQRLLRIKVLNARKKRELREEFESLDPFILHQKLEAALRPILSKAVEVN